LLLGHAILSSRPIGIQAGAESASGLLRKHVLLVLLVCRLSVLGVYELLLQLQSLLVLRRQLVDVQ